MQDSIWAVSWENWPFAYAKTKAQDSCAVTAQLISTFAFTIEIVQSLYFLNPIFQASGYRAADSAFLCYIDRLYTSHIMRKQAFCI